jgi:iron complex outermembrane recepter protein
MTMTAAVASFSRISGSFTRLALCAAVLAASQALAQGALEEIVVTAQKREQSLQDAPIAISAFSSEALEQQGISDVRDISGFVPNVQINSSPGGGTGATVAIRGSVTINPAVTWEPTVGMYLDGAFIGKNLGGIFDVADLERIEVLRGPQGSLYGKNTVGGAINLISRKPSGEFSGSLLAGVEEFDSTSQTLTVDYELCPNDILGEASLKYIANIRDLDFAQSLDNDGTPYGLFHSAIDEEYTQQSHEVQLTGSHERVNYVVGVYYFEEEADAYNPLQPLNSFFGPLLNRNAYGLESEQIAVYGQADWRPPVLDDRLTITLGVRWTDEEKEVYISHPDDPVPFAGQNDDSFTNTSPTVIFSYELADELNVYAKYAQGWKSGGFNGEAGSIESFNRGFGPEEIDSWEAGFKSRWLDNTLQVNGAVFYNDETDIQLSVFVPSGALPISVIENAGQSEKKGFELEVVYMPTADLQFMLNYGYLDSEFKEFLEFDPATGGTINVADQRFTQYTPEHTFNAGVEYTMLRASYGELTARLDYSYNDDYTPYVTPAQKAVSDIDGYGVLNGRLTLADIPAGDNKLQLALWGKNLLDEEYRLNTVPFGPFAVSFFGNPRTYGLDATYSF